jgi:cation diffusion facilitator family transporter
MKLPGEPFRIPPDKKPVSDRAKKLEWLTIIFMLSIIALIGLVMGSSQTMKALWVEDAFSLVPPIAFLLGRRFNHRPPDDRFPYGYRRAVAIGFQTAAVALLAVGLYTLIDSAMKLISAEAPTIGTVELFGRRLWLGWLMIAALLYSVIPPFVLGRMKLPVARELNDKALYTDAKINKGDWLSGIAGMLGLFGIAYGLWWADAVAALIISGDIIYDGWTDLRESVAQLMNKRPSTMDGEDDDVVPTKLREELERLDWIAEARVRLREDGDALSGEVFVVPKNEDNLLERLQQATDVANSVDWRLYDVNVVPVRSFEP